MDEIKRYRINRLLGMLSAYILTVISLSIIVFLTAKYDAKLGLLVLTILPVCLAFLTILFDESDDIYRRNLEWKLKEQKEASERPMGSLYGEYWRPDYDWEEYDEKSTKQTHDFSHGKNW